MSAVTLRGITWDHTRGLLPLVATAQRFHERNPGIEITWEKRSLQQFGDQPIGKLAETFDLLVIDHPFVGTAAATRVLLPLDEHLPADFLADQAAHSVGASHSSYSYGDHHWALAIDAATPVAAWRADLIARHQATVPRNWSELLTLAARGLVAVPAIAVDALMNLYPLCLARGGELFKSTELFVDQGPGLAALEDLCALVHACSSGCLSRNPIRTYEALATADESGPAYCPLAYGYSNYSRPGYGAQPLDFGPPPRGVDGQPLRSTLGGTGLAIATHCSHRAEALAYAQFVADGRTQRSIYAAAGGQPGHRRAWLEADNNAAARDYFIRTLPALDAAYLRPRYHGYLHFQDHGGPVVHRFLHGEYDARTALAGLNALYRESQSPQ